MSEPIRFGLVGLGAMGRHHARILSAMRDIELVAAADVDGSVAERIGMRHLHIYPEAEELFESERIDAVVVATPTTTHSSIALAAFDRGVHVLVEKPLAASVDEARSLVERARTAHVVLAVGHIERFNPAVRALKARLDEGEIGKLFQIAVRREGPFPTRIADVGVTGDLATHDLDIIGHLLNSHPEMLFAQVAKRVHAQQEDLLAAVLRYPGGIIATLGVNWLTPIKIRELAVTGERGRYVVDYLTQDLIWHENSEVGERWDALDTLRGVSQGRSVTYPIRRREPLAVELAEFAEVLRGRPGNIVTGSEGMVALSLAASLLESATNQAPVFHPVGHHPWNAPG